MSGRRADAARAAVLERERATATAAEQRKELLAKHSAADRVQEKVNGEAGHVQGLGVVTEHVERREADSDDTRHLHLEDDEVDEYGKVEEDVRRRHEDEDDGQLEVFLVQTVASNAPRTDRYSALVDAVGDDRGCRCSGVDRQQRDVSAPAFAVASYACNT